MQLREITDVIGARLRELGLSVHRAEREAGLPEDAIRNVLGGSDPHATRLAEISAALGLEFRVEKPREAQRDVPGPFMQGDGDDFTCPWPVPLSADETDYPESGYAPVGCVWFGSRFLQRARLDPWSCEVARLADDSMAPSLPEGTFVLVDLRRKRREQGCIYRVRHKRTFLVRRAAKIGGLWELHAEGQGQEVLVWDRRVATVGQVVWMGRVFVPMTPRDAA